MVRIAAFVLGLVLLASPVAAQTEPVLRITGFGEVAGREIGDSDRITSSGDRLRSFEGARIIRSTTAIIARLCRRFGMVYRAENLGPGQIAEVTIRAEHPPLHRPDGRVSTGTTYTNFIGSEQPGYVGFTFDETWELVAGTWTFAVMFHDKVLVEQRFEVALPPDGGHPLMGACDDPIS